MYSENEDFEDDYKENNSGSFTDKLKEFYDGNKKLVWILGGLLLFILILSMFNGCSGNPQGGGVKPEDISVVLNEEKMYITVGNSQKLIATPQPDSGDYRSAEYEWISSNEDVATIDTLGNINALKLGSTLITVTMTYNEQKYTDVCEIVVIEGEQDVSITDVSFPEGELLITIGDSYQLTKVVTPSNGFIENISYTSSNTSIVDVDDKGSIKSLAEGIATITMSVNDGQFKDEINVNVVSENIDPQMIFYPTNIVFDKNEVTLVEGKTEELTYQTLPSNAYRKNMKWSSTDISVATVDENGVITAKKAGITVISVVAPNGTKGEISVKVESAVVNVTSLDILSAKTVNLNVGGTSLIIPNVLPANATNKSVTYSSSDSGIAIVDNAGTITAISAGTAVITVTTNDGLKTATVTVTVNGSSSSGGSSSGGSSSGGSSSGGSSSISVTGVSLKDADKDIKIKVSDEYVIVPNIKPTNASNKKITCTSSKTSVATATASGNNCKVVAKGVGTATITIKTKDGSKSVTSNVTVSSNITTSSEYNFGYNFSYNDTFFRASGFKYLQYIKMNLRITNKSTSGNQNIYFCVNESSSTAKSATSTKKYSGVRVPDSTISQDSTNFHAQDSNTCNKANYNSWTLYVPCGATVCAHVEVDGVKYAEKCLPKPSCP